MIENHEEICKRFTSYILEKYSYRILNMFTDFSKTDIYITVELDIDGGYRRVDRENLEIRFYFIYDSIDDDNSFCFGINSSVSTVLYEQLSEKFFNLHRIFNKWYSGIEELNIKMDLMGI
jgi:hypothetical protein